ESDSIADKHQKRGEIAIPRYPNSFSLHALYQCGDDRWLYKELYAVARTGFHKVSEVKPEAIKLQLRSKFIIFMNQDGSLPDGFDEKRLKEIYEPQTMVLSLRKGVPFLE